MMFLCLTIWPNTSYCDPAVIAPCSAVGCVHEVCKCRIECGEESNPAWVDPGYCSQWSAGYGQADHGCFSRTVTVCNVHGSDQNGRTKNLLFVEYWLMSLAVTRQCMRLVTNLKLKTRLNVRYVRGKVQWQTSRIYNGAEWRVKNIVVSATPPPTVSPIRSQIGSQSQQISVASCRWLFCYDMPTLHEDSTFLRNVGFT
jgi:hypothetical protein